MTNANAFRVPAALAYPIGIAVICATAYLGSTLSRTSRDSELLKKVLFLAAVSLVTLLVISCTKRIMCRPRFRLVLALENTDYFRSWWQTGRALKASAGAGIGGDEFASLPSGHSAYSMFAIYLLPALSDYADRLKRYRLCLFVTGFLWWAMTALSRMTVGAHYLTDVTIAGLVSILAYALVSAVWRFLSKRNGTNAQRKS
jgi:membrane-associated phospholipid phosphatase